MADFCKCCSLEKFGKDYGDLTYLLTEEECKLGFRATALCEGCGIISVDHQGVRWTGEEVEGKYKWTRDPRLK